MRVCICQVYYFAIVLCRSCTGGKTEDFVAAAQLFYKSNQAVKVPTFLVPATQKVWADVYALPVPGCNGKTAAQIFSDAGCESPASPSCAACLGATLHLVTMPCSKLLSGISNPFSLKLIFEIMACIAHHGVSDCTE